MSVLITGLNGTLAPHVANALKIAGHAVAAWDRTLVDPGTATQSQITHHLDRLAPDGIIHLAMGPESWAAAMASHMAERGLPFVFTSTAMVFDAGSGGPHHVHDRPTATDGYGVYKIGCEDAVLAASRSAVVARIGWQIDCDSLTGNNMLAQLMSQAQAGPIRASAAWIPATSFMPVTAAGLFGLYQLASIGKAGGLHHLDSNALASLTFPQIVKGLSRQVGELWEIEVTCDYVHDQRLMPAPRTDTILLPGLPFSSA